jgi:restriction system protein
VAEITRKRIGELVAGLMKLLSNRPEGMPAKEVLLQLRSLVPPTAFELSEYPNRPGVVRYDKIVRFATIGPVKAGWLVKTKGQWSITEAGVAALAQFAKDPEGLMREAHRLYRQWKKGQPEPTEEAEPPADEAVEVVGTLEEAEEAAFAEIKSYLDEMAPYDFQDLVAALIAAMGYHVQWVAPPGPDQGVDIIASADQLGLSKPRVKVQVKHRAATSSVSDLREFMALLGESDVGIFVSSGGFTRDAQIEARTHETRTLTLLDLEGLLDLWIANYTSVDEEKKRLLPLKPVHYLALPTEP